MEPIGSSLLPLLLLLLLGLLALLLVSQCVVGSMSKPDDDDDSLESCCCAGKHCSSWLSRSITFTHRIRPPRSNGRPQDISDTMQLGAGR